MLGLSEAGLAGAPRARKHTFRKYNFLDTTEITPNNFYICEQFDCNETKAIKIRQKAIEYRTPPSALKQALNKSLYPKMMRNAV